MKRSCLAIALVLSINAIAPLSFADAYDAAMARAVAAKEKAVDSNDPGAWEEALRLFTEADAIKPTKDSKYELAGAAARLKEDDVAFEAYEAAIALGLTGKAKEKAQAFIKAQKGFGRVDVKGPAGAEIYVGARRRGTLPHAPIVVFAGAVKIRATSSGQTVERTLDVKDGATETLDLAPEFAPKAAVVTPPPGPAKSTPKEGSPTVPLTDTGAGARTLGWSLIVGGGVLVLVGGGGFAASAAGISKGQSDLAKACDRFFADKPDQCQTTKPTAVGEAQTANNTITTWKGVRTAALVTGGVGVVIFVVGIARLVTAPPAPKASAWVPRLDVGLGYVGLSGVF